MCSMGLQQKANTCLESVDVPNSTRNQILLGCGRSNGVTQARLQISSTLNPEPRTRTWEKTIGLRLEVAGGRDEHVAHQAWCRHFLGSELVYGVVLYCVLLILRITFKDVTRHYLIIYKKFSPMLIYFCSILASLAWSDLTYLISLSLCTN